VERARPAQSTPVDGERARALDALLAGNAREAAAGFERVIRARPRDVAAQFLHFASAAAIGEATSEARDALGRPVAVATLPLGYQLRAPLPVPAAGRPLTLHRAGATKNLIVDDADWFSRHALTPPVKRPAPVEMPEHVARTAGGNRPTLLFSHADHDVVVYGRLLGVFAKGKTARLIDLGGAAKTVGGRELEVDYAQAVGRALVVQLSINGYSSDVVGKTAFVAAFDMATGQLHWCSEPLVGNAHNFLVTGEHIVSGYGFTAEPDHLFVLELRTGKVVHRLPVQSGPDYILPKNGQLLVRTYDMDYAFRVEPAITPAPPAELSAGKGARRSDSDRDARCWIDNAVAAIDARDEAGLRTALGALDGRVDDTLTAALQGALQFFEQRRSRTPGVDLTTQDPVVVEAPPWDYALRAAPPVNPPRAPRLVRSHGAAADPVRDMNNRRTRAGAFLLAPVDRGRLPPGAPQGIPSSYAFEDLRGVIPSGDRLLLVYGGRYLAVTRGGQTERIFDLEALRHPPKANPQWKEFAVQDVTYAAVIEGVVYVANGGGSYAKEVFGKKGFMTALDLASGKLLWRSQPLVTGGIFALWRDFIVTGYGFTAEPDNLFVLRRADGRVVTRAALESAPHDITVSGDRVHVEAYGHAYDFEIQP
jgi:hypothetical protein